MRREFLTVTCGGMTLRSDRGYLDPWGRTGVRPDSAQVSGGTLSVAAAHLLFGVWL